MRWRLILEEFRFELKYIKGENKFVADALSRLEISDNQKILNISELCGYNAVDLNDIAHWIRSMIALDWGFLVVIGFFFRP